MQHGYATQICSLKMLHGHAAVICSISKQHDRAAWTSNIDMQHGDMNIEQRYEAGTCSIGMQKGHLK
jgi:hypothetical protein